MISVAITHRLLFVDDHPIYCEGLAFALRSRVPGLKVFTVGDGASALRLLSHEDIDLLLSDYHLPGEDGLSVLGQVSASHPSVALGLLCADVTPVLAQRAMAIGAVACLSKQRDMGSLAQALQRLLDGETVFDQQPPKRLQHGISDHRLEIIRMASLGLSNKHIARELAITERTVKDHWQVIFERLEVGNRIEAINAALKHGLIEIATEHAVQPG